MKCTHTADNLELKYEAAKATLTFGATEPPAPGLPAFHTKFHFEPGAKFDSFLHFHVSHAEYLYCEKGSIRVTIGAVVRIVGPEDGQLEIPAWTPHQRETLETNKETIVWERTDPNDGQKELFFRNLMSLINDYKGSLPFLQTFKIFSDYDNYPGKHAGVAGYRSVYKEYTPKRLLKS
ncbi:uncharacterized protein B0H18DRAFT_1117729 [Fomitopsis serialis]|uniref:uncharacterized protein n=1 Tax=Fomitopsis serialis TaxID=139415 RepID=UPI002007EB3B|nr:uncharacterized protein B0H18DRAFT_1117729 [Neoantrodia serialis]KAH9928913.1 hypothetical protein B0H18DRAFT_1117729 [Neoantrodia serialis]